MALVPMFTLPVFGIFDKILISGCNIDLFLPVVSKFRYLSRASTFIVRPRTLTDHAAALFGLMTQSVLMRTQRNIVKAYGLDRALSFIVPA